MCIGRLVQRWYASPVLREVGMVKTTRQVQRSPHDVLPNITPLGVLENVQQSIDTYS